MTIRNIILIGVFALATGMAAQDHLQFLWDYDDASVNAESLCIISPLPKEMNMPTSLSIHGFMRIFDDLIVYLPM